MRAPSRSIHFISVSRAGVLVARRKGKAPVNVATAAEGLVVVPDEEARGRGLPALLRVFFRHGGRHLHLHVTAVSIGQEQVELNAFQARFSVSNAELGKWIRAAVERALDAADGQ